MFENQARLCFFYRSKLRTACAARPPETALSVLNGFSAFTRACRHCFTTANAPHNRTARCGLRREYPYDGSWDKRGNQGSAPSLPKLWTTWRRRTRSLARSGWSRQHKG